MKPEKSGDGRCHIAPFPYELPYKFIKAYSFIGEIILDPFCGSGTTMLAAKNLSRNSIGYEINPVFANIIKERFEQEKYSLFKECNENKF
jgi:DNA modification methylase